MENVLYLPNFHSFHPTSFFVVCFFFFKVTCCVTTQKNTFSAWLSLHASVTIIIKKNCKGLCYKQMPFLFWEASRCWELKQFQISFLLEVPSESQKENLSRNPIQISTRTRNSNCSGFMPGLYVNDSPWNFIMWWVLQEEFVSCKSPPFHRSNYFDTKWWGIMQ